MKTPERFNNAMKALIKGFFDETLMKGDCSACAVGNILNGSYIWNRLFYTNKYGIKERKPSSTETIVEAIDLCRSSGYSVGDLMKVEYAFETNTVIDGILYSNRGKQEIVQDQYNGLMAVVEVLCEIEGIDTKEYKKEFEYALNGDILEKINN